MIFKVHARCPKIYENSQKHNSDVTLHRCQKEKEEHDGRRGGKHCLTEIRKNPAKKNNEANRL